MPSLIEVLKNYPQVNKSTSSYAQTTEDVARFSRYVSYWRMYLGEHWNKPRTDGEEQLTVNFCAKFVDKQAAFLMSKGWQINDPDTGYASETQPLLDEVWRYNQKEVTSIEFAQMGGITGDAFLLIAPTQDYNIKISVIPSMYVIPFFDPSDKTRLIGARIDFPMAAVQSGQISVMSIVMDMNRLTYFVDGEPQSTLDHMLGEVPLIYCRNRTLAGAQYGLSDLWMLTSLQKTFNHKLTNLSDILNYQASPTTLGYGVRLNQMQRGARKMYANLPIDSRVENLEMKSDLHSSTEFIKYLERMLHVLGDTPQIALANYDALAISNTSGLAIQLMFQPLIDAVDHKRQTYGYALVNANRIILKYAVNMGILIAPSSLTEQRKYYDTLIKFNDALPRDELIKLNIIINKLTNGLITVKDALEQLGETNVLEYIKEIEDDIKTGRNIPASTNVAKTLFSNIGGIARDGATSSQLNKSANKEAAQNAAA